MFLQCVRDSLSFLLLLQSCKAKTKPINPRKKMSVVCSGTYLVLHIPACCRRHCLHSTLDRAASHPGSYFPSHRACQNTIFYGVVTIALSISKTAKNVYFDCARKRLNAVPTSKLDLSQGGLQYPLHTSMPLKCHRGRTVEGTLWVVNTKLGIYALMYGFDMYCI